MVLVIANEFFFDVLLTSRGVLTMLDNTQRDNHKGCYISKPRMFLHCFSGSPNIPNGLGSISGIVLLILYATYYKTTNWNDEDDDKEKGYSNAEIELGRA
ncbi:hypothetical protein YC2023_072842 [Brassica napus]